MIKLVSATLQHDRIPRLALSDGSEGDFGVAPTLARDTALTRPFVQAEYFSRSFLELGALCWPNGLEFSARSLHAKLKRARSLHHTATA